MQYMMDQMDLWDKTLGRYLTPASTTVPGLVTASATDRTVYPVQYCY